MKNYNTAETPALITMVKYAENNEADPIKVSLPDQVNYVAGVIPNQGLPAAWWNGFNNKYTDNQNKIAALFADLYTEFKNFVIEWIPAGLSGADSSQLKKAFAAALAAAVADVSASKVTFTAVTSYSAIVSGDTLATLFGKLAFWPTYFAIRSHTSTATVYGAGTNTDYGHVKGDASTITIEAGIVKGKGGTDGQILMTNASGVAYWGTPPSLKASAYSMVWAGDSVANQTITITGVNPADYSIITAPAADWTATKTSATVLTVKPNTVSTDATTKSSSVVLGNGSDRITIALTQRARLTKLTSSTYSMSWAGVNIANQTATITGTDPAGYSIITAPATGWTATKTSDTVLTVKPAATNTTAANKTTTVVLGNGSQRITIALTQLASVAAITATPMTLTWTGKDVAEKTVAITPTNPAAYSIITAPSAYFTAVKTSNTVLTVTPAEELINGSSRISTVVIGNGNYRLTISLVQKAYGFTTKSAATSMYVGNIGAQDIPGNSLVCVEEKYKDVCFHGGGTFPSSLDASAFYIPWDEGYMGVVNPSQGLRVRSCDTTDDTWYDWTGSLPTMNRKPVACCSATQLIVGFNQEIYSMKENQRGVWQLVYSGTYSDWWVGVVVTNDPDIFIFSRDRQDGQGIGPTVLYADGSVLHGISDNQLRRPSNLIWWAKEGVAVLAAASNNSMAFVDIADSPTPSLTSLTNPPVTPGALFKIVAEPSLDDGRLILINGTTRNSWALQGKATTNAWGPLSSPAATATGVTCGVAVAKGGIAVTRQVAGLLCFLPRGSDIWEVVGEYKSSSVDNTDHLVYAPDRFLMSKGGAGHLTELALIPDKCFATSPAGGRVMLGINMSTAYAGKVYQYGFREYYNDGVENTEAYLPSWQTG